MYTIEKKVAGKYVFGRCLRMLLIFAGIALMIAACSKDEEELKKDLPPKETPPGDGNQGGGQDTIVTPSDSIDADVILEHLSLMDAAKITGEMPDVPVTPFPPDVNDTIFLVKDSSYGYRMRLQHDGLFDVTGIFVGIPNGSFYYDVPIVPSEAQDSTDVVYINFDNLPVADFKDYPVSFPVTLMPHTNGMPIKNHTGVIKIEEQKKDDFCSVTVPVGSEPDYKWVWAYTLITDENHQLIRVEAPSINPYKGYQTGGCCNADGSSSSVAESPSCTHYLLDTITNLPDPTKVNPRWRPLDVKQHYTFWDEFYLFDNGTFEQNGHSYQTNVSLSKSNFCNNEVFYYDESREFPNSGTHDFTRGADYINISYDVSQVAKKTLQSGSILYTCHWFGLTYAVQSDGTMTYEKIFMKWKRRPSEVGTEVWEATCYIPFLGEI